jgi:hypothetical protein
MKAKEINLPRSIGRPFKAFAQRQIMFSNRKRKAKSRRHDFGNSGARVSGVTSSLPETATSRTNKIRVLD